MAKKNVRKISNEDRLAEYQNRKTYDDFVIDEKTGKISKLIDIEKLYAAPNEWNFFDKLKEDKMFELMESIIENGLLSPIHVWKKEPNRYMILAGHNRVEAFKSLYEKLKDEQFKHIPAFIYEAEELDETKAKSIIIDTNYVQRALSVKEKTQSVLYKYDAIKETSTNVKNAIAESLGISPRSVMMYKNVEKLIPPIKTMIFKGDISLTAGLKLTSFSEEIQEWLFQNYSDELVNPKLNKIKPYMKRADLEKLFKKEEMINTVKITVDVPDGLVDEFKEMFKQWKYNKTNRG